MKTKFVVSLFSVILIVEGIHFTGYCQTQNQNSGGDIEILIVFDNYAINQELGTSWGFGAVIKTPTDVILFDTGGNRSLLLSNMEKMQINPKDIDIVVLSHRHGDHTGGLDGFLKTNSDVKVYIPYTFPNSIRDMIVSHGVELFEVSDSEQLSAVAYTTGVMGSSIQEQSLILDTNEGLVVITGCAHPGIVNITRKAKEILPNKDIYLVTGGFHLIEKSDSELKSILSELRDLGVQKVAPSHCSGDRCRELFKEEYGTEYIDIGVGKRIVL